MGQDKLEELSDIWVDFTKGLEALAVSLRRQIQGLAESGTEALNELSFTILSWQAEKGSKLGDYEAAYKGMNLPDKWQRAFNILQVNNAVIGSPLKAEDWGYRYWIYPERYDDRVYRKKRS